MSVRPVNFVGRSVYRPSHTGRDESNRGIRCATRQSRRKDAECKTVGIRGFRTHLRKPVYQKRQFLQPVKHLTVF